MDRLDTLESDSIYLIREAFHYYPRLALLWSMGKDSTALLWLCRKAFLGTIPFSVIHIDTTYKFPEMYAFREQYAKEWGLDLRIIRNEEALRQGIGYATHDAFTVCTALKTDALRKAITDEHLQAVLVGIRRDEHGVRAKERAFSPRNDMFEWNYAQQPNEVWDYRMTNVERDTHMRVHPLLAWSEVDIWTYTKRESIPVCPLYFSDHGKRYRSLGCMPITEPIRSDAATIDAVLAELRWDPLESTCRHASLSIL